LVSKHPRRRLPYPRVRQRRSGARLLAAVLCLSLTLAARDLGPDFVLRAQSTPPEAWQTDAHSALVADLPDTGQAIRLEVGRGVFRLVRSSQTGSEVLAGPRDLRAQGGGPGTLVLRCLAGRWLACAGDAWLTTTAPAPMRATARLETAPGGPVLSQLRIQPLAPLAFADDFMRTAGETGAWKPLGGTWELDQLPNADWTPNAFRYVGRGRGHSLACAGEWFWDGYGVGVALQPGREAGAAGLACAVQDDGSALVFRWADSGRGHPGCRAGRLELVRARPDAEDVLQQLPWTWDPGQWYRFGLVVLEGRVSAFVDDRRVLSVQTNAAWGRIGLYCRDSTGTRFDDVVLRSLPAPVLREGVGSEAGASLLPRLASTVAERFRTDQYMQGWASELGSWVPVPGAPQPHTYRHIGLFPGDFVLSWDSPEPVPFDQGAIEVQALPEGGTAADGYLLRLSRSGDGCVASALRQNRLLGEGRAALPAGTPIHSLRLTRTADALAAQVNGTEILACTDPEPLATRRLVAVCPWTLDRELHAFSTETVYSRRQRLPAVLDLGGECPQLHDYLFDRVPSEWLADRGTWEVTPRWICLPMFSWLGGRSHENAVLWNKHRFAGDLVVDLHAAVMMDFGPMSGYDRYGDLCLTVCADGRDLSSGYTVQFGAEGNRVSRLWRRDVVVAANPAVTYPPRSEGAHQSWYHLTVEKRGEEVTFRVDNRPVVSFRDPEPLAGGHVALWTWNRGMMVARARVWAEVDEGMQVEPFLRPLAPARAPDPAAAPAPMASSATHPGRLFRFDSGTEGWGTTSPQYGAAVDWEPVDGGGVLRCTNPRTGGDLSVAFPVAPFEALAWPLLEFDAAFEPGTKVNLYVRADGQWHVLGLTGPVAAEFHQISESREISGRLTATAGLQLEEPPPVCLGDLAIPDDGAWRPVRVALLACLERLYPERTAFRISDLQLGNWSNEEYLQCGFGGNRAGAVYRLDNVWLGAAGGGRGAELSLSAPPPAGEGWLWCADRSPDTVPDGAIEPGRRDLLLEGLASGAWYLHLAPAARGGQAQALHYRFLVDSQAPLLTRAEPGDGEDAAPAALRLTVDESGGSGLDRRSLVIGVGEQGLDPGQVTWEEEAGRTVITASLQGLTFSDGQTVPCSLRLADRAGNSVAGPSSWQWTFRQAADRTGPSRPVLTLPAPAPWDQDFEHPGGDWGRFPGSAWAEAVLDDTTAASGRRCLRVSGGPGPYRCYIRREPFDLLSRPVLVLDYQVDANAVWDLALETDRGWWVAAVSNASSAWPAVGRMTDYRADGQWHTAIMPVAEWLGRRQAFTVPVVRAVAVVADRMEGGRPTSVRLDALRLAPAVWPGAAAQLQWQATDAGGIAGYRYLADRQPATVPDATGPLGSPSCEVRTLSAGLQALHVQAWDNAGNAGPVLHQPLVVRNDEDGTPPRVTEAKPPAGASAAPDEVSIRIAEAGSGLSLETLLLEVDGRAYTFRDPSLAFGPEEGLVRWRRPPGASPAQPLFPEGHEVSFRLSCRDRAGNPATGPLSWSWTMAFAEDRTPPPAPCLSWGTDQVFLDQDFEADAGLCMGLREGWAVRTEEDAGTGSACLRFGGFSTFLCASSYPADRFPFLSFLYRFEPGCEANLLVRSENRNWEVQLNGSGPRYPLVGRAEGILADGRWHFCRLNLAEMLRRAPRPSRTLAVDHVASLVKSGDGFRVDDVRVEGPGTGAVTARWSVPRDATGIQGYSVAVDDRPDTVPDTTLDTSDCRQDIRLPESGWAWLHVRAVDGAGNGGETAHIRIEPGAAPTPPTAP
jgi:hypothetical protein